MNKRTILTRKWCCRYHSLNVPWTVIQITRLDVINQPFKLSSNINTNGPALLTAVISGFLKYVVSPNFNM